jgi:hypothetical protein
MAPRPLWTVNRPDFWACELRIIAFIAHPNHWVYRPNWGGARASKSAQLPYRCPASFGWVSHKVPNPQSTAGLPEVLSAEEEAELPKAVRQA